MIPEQEKYRQIINRVIAGDTSAFLVIVDGHKKLVSRLVWRMIDRAADREDLCQDVFFKVYKNLAKFKFECKLSTWIARISYNTCLNYIEKKRSTLFDDAEQSEAGIQIFPDESRSAAHLYAEKDAARRVQAVVNALPAKYRTVLMLFHIEEMKYEEISEIMDLPVGTIKSHLFRARRLLKENLQNKYKRDELWR